MGTDAHLAAGKNGAWGEEIVSCTRQSKASCPQSPATRYRRLVPMLRLAGSPMVVSLCVLIRCVQVVVDLH